MEAAEAKRLLAGAVPCNDEDDEEASEPVHLPAAVLDELNVSDLPEGVNIGIGEHRSGVLHIVWQGTLRRTGGAILAEVDLSWTKKYWSLPIGLDHYLDLVRRAVEKRERSHGDVRIILHEDDDEPWVRLIFELSGLPSSTLGAAYDAARRRTQELFEAADSTAIAAGRLIAAAAQRLDGWGTLPLDQLVDRVDQTTNANTKGRLLEEFTARLFGSISGISVLGRIRTATEEIDVTLLNGSKDPRLSRESAIIIVECKNWLSKCGKDEFVVFHSKIANRSDRCTLGFLVSWNGFTGTVTSEMLRGSRERTLVVPLAGSDLREAVRSGDATTVIFDAWQKAVMM